MYKITLSLIIRHKSHEKYCAQVRCAHVTIEFQNKRIHPFKGYAATMLVVSASWGGNREVVSSDLTTLRLSRGVVVTTSPTAEPTARSIMAVDNWLRNRLSMLRLVLRLPNAKVSWSFCEGKVGRGAGLMGDSNGVKCMRVV